MYQSLHLSYQPSQVKYTAALNDLRSVRGTTGVAQSNMNFVTQCSIEFVTLFKVAAFPFGPLPVSLVINKSRVVGESQSYSRCQI